MEILIGLYAVCLLGIQTTQLVFSQTSAEQTAEQDWPAPFSFI